MLFQELNRLNLDFVRTLKGFVSIIINPGNTDSVFDISQGIRNTEASNLALEYLKSQPGVSEILEERYLPPTPDLDLLITYPKDSLGYVYASKMKQDNFDPEFYQKIEVKDDLSYIILRQRQSHDIWHTVTDFGTDVTAELGLQSFTLAQTRLPLPIILIAGGLLKTLLQSPAEMSRLLDQIAIGYRMGSKAKPFLAQKWEEHWDKPLAELRAELGVEPTTVYLP
ncbi:Coq4 family protein [Capilliphycus salinus ALCB114379]|uniref:Coq4 family protein n=1 Tax=Capilliphycus salinus TaxID=2768948 RepID=UPI0039A6FB2B